MFLYKLQILNEKSENIFEKYQYGRQTKHNKTHNTNLTLSSPRIVKRNLSKSPVNFLEKPSSKQITRIHSQTRRYTDNIITNHISKPVLIYKANKSKLHQKLNSPEVFNIKVNHRSKSHNLFKCKSIIFGSASHGKVLAKKVLTHRPMCFKSPSKTDRLECNETSLSRSGKYTRSTHRTNFKISQSSVPKITRIKSIESNMMNPHKKSEHTQRQYKRDTRTNKFSSTNRPRKIKFIKIQNFQEGRQNRKTKQFVINPEDLNKYFNKRDSLRMNSESVKKRKPLQVSSKSNANSLSVSPIPNLLHYSNIGFNTLIIHFVFKYLF